MQTVTLRSPAKLNLVLKVLQIRPDGYHNLKTIFERIDLCDDITFKPNKTGRIRIACAHPQVPLGPKNLIYQVAQQFQRAYGVKTGADIRITKRIPVAAGLAGGSSNAASALLGLNALWGLKLSRPALISHARKIGSDVPFFVYNCSWALGTERGDRIQQIPVSTKLWHILVVPCIKMYSREVFTCLKRKLTKKRVNVNILIRYLKNNNIRGIEQLLENDLESSILSIHPQLGNVKSRLQACQLEGVAFSGSGPSVFGITDSKQHAEKLRTLLNKKYKQVFVVRTL